MKRYSWILRINIVKMAQRDTTQNHVLIQYNPHQNSNGIFQTNRKKNNPKIHMEPKRP